MQFPPFSPFSPFPPFPFYDMFFLFLIKMSFCYGIMKIGKYTAKLTFLWYDILVKKVSLQRNGMAAIPKTF